MRASASAAATAAGRATTPAAQLRADLAADPVQTGSVASRFAALVAADQLRLPLPGRGETGARWEALAEIGAADLALARLAEGHVDACAIVVEAGAEPVDGARYGVWAAEPPGSGVVATTVDDGWQLDGTKRYGSGARTLTRALVTASAPDGPRLYDVDLGDPGVQPVPGTWPALGMAESDSLDVTFSGVRVPRAAALGGPRFYVERPGFSHGAMGVAACWYGGALGTARMVRGRLAERADAHSLAHLGAIATTCATLREVLHSAAAAVDADPHAAGAPARQRALVVRAAVEHGCQEVLARAGRATGTSPLALDATHARRAADLVVYLRQHHAERDLAELGALVLDDDAWR